MATYYIDSLSGDDDNDGLSEETPWESFDHINNAMFIYDLPYQFEDGFEDSGDSWDQLAYGPEFVAAAKRTGDLGMRVSGNSAQYVRKDIQPPNISDPHKGGYEEMDFTFYVYFHTLDGFTSGKEAVYARANSAGETGGASANLSLWHDGDSIVWRLFLPNSSTAYLADSGPDVETWYKVEVHWEKSSGASDGVVQVSIADVLIFDQTHNDIRDISSNFLGIVDNIYEDITFVAHYDDVIMDGTRAYYPPGFSPGDRIRLRSGQSWEQVLKPTCSGDAVTGPIVFETYDKGVGKTAWLKSGMDLLGKEYEDFHGLRISGDRIWANKGEKNIRFFSSIIENTGTYGFYGENGPTNIEFWNCAFARSEYYHVRTTGAATVKVRNCVFLTNAWDQGPFNIGTGGSLDFDYCYATHWRTENFDMTNVTDGGHNILYDHPYISRYTTDTTPRFALTFDDNYVDEFESMADGVFETYGIKATIFVCPGALSASQKTKLAALSARGHEVANHTWCHTSLTATDALTFENSNGNATVDVDVATTTITLTAPNGGGVLAFNWSGGKTVADLKASAEGDWTITNLLYDGYGTRQDALKLDCLADSGGPQLVPYTALLDVSAPDYRFWDHEVNDAQDEIEAITGVRPVTMAYPYGFNNESLITWLKANTDLKSARRVGGAPPKLLSVPIWQFIQRTTGWDLETPPEATVREWARRHWLYAKMTPGYFLYYEHDTDQDYWDRVGWMADEIQSLGGVFVTYREMVEWIESDHTVSGDNWVKTYDVDGAYYRPRKSSPFLDAGVDSGLDEDIEGVVIPQGDGDDLGPYEGLGAGQIWVQAGGGWERVASSYCKVAGEWEAAVVWKKEDGIWERMTA